MGRFGVAELTLTQADNGKSVEAYQGDVVLIRLPENPTTGYRWAIAAIDEEIMEPSSSYFTLSSDARIGGGGERIFTFVTKSSGTTHLELKLWREWEGDSSVIQRYELTIHIG